MAYHVPPAIPRSARPWWLWLLWIGGLSSYLVGLRYLGQFSTPFASGTLRTIDDSLQVQAGVSGLLLLIVFIIRMIFTTSRMWRGAWIGMTIVTGLLLVQSIALAQDVLRLRQHFSGFFAARWADDATRVPWLLVGGAGILMLTCLVAIGDRRHAGLCDQHPTD